MDKQLGTTETCSQKLNLNSENTKFPIPNRKNNYILQFCKTMDLSFSVSLMRTKGRVIISGIVIGKY